MPDVLTCDTLAEAARSPTGAAQSSPVRREVIRLRGVVQGVGLRPFVLRVAAELGIVGTVINDGEGVLVDAVADLARLDRMVERLRCEAPPLARIDVIERLRQQAIDPLPAGFFIGASCSGATLTVIPADAATCTTCIAEMLDPRERRYRYPLTNCTSCGPRFSFVTGMPYDRAQTTMAGWPMCAACRAEYDDPADRRFHAQAIACPACGPKVELRRADGQAAAGEVKGWRDACEAAAALLERGKVIAIKGLGGYQLACDATQSAVVQRLRRLKRREAKPFALLGADLEMVQRYCDVGEAEREALLSAAAPVVLLRRRDHRPDSFIADAVAPRIDSLGFMLPSTGILQLVMQRMKQPIVLTSGNLSDEPQAITRSELHQRFAAGIDFVLDHDRPIARRIDDSIVRVADGRQQVLRRARGLAPQPLPMPAGFEAAPAVLAYGSDLKNSFCLLRNGQAVPSQHVGDLTDAAVLADYHRALADLSAFFGFDARRHACDAHPGYLSSQVARERGGVGTGRLVEVLHHHAHLAACLVDNGWPLAAGPVLGVALDGIGYGVATDGNGKDRGEAWGGEFAIVDYTSFERRACFKPVALLGGDAAAREPWRNAYSQLIAAVGWTHFERRCRGLDLHRFLAAKPREVLDVMLARQINSPLSSSCGRLFDAVAAAIGICRERVAYEGQAAIELEAIVDRRLLQPAHDREAYRLEIAFSDDVGLPVIDPRPMWIALLDDLLAQTPLATIAARFHLGLADAIVEMAARLAADRAGRPPLRHVALSGGVFQNRILLELVCGRLRSAGFVALSHERIPCNDGGIAIGQAAVAAAQALQPLTEPEQ